MRLVMFRGRWHAYERVDGQLTRTSSGAGGASDCGMTADSSLPLSIGREGLRSRNPAWPPEHQ
jgi:hypothetical protein